MGNKEVRLRTPRFPVIPIIATMMRVSFCVSESETPEPGHRALQLSAYPCARPPVTCTRNPGGAGQDKKGEQMFDTPKCTSLGYWVLRNRKLGKKRLLSCHCLNIFRQRTCSGREPYSQVTQVEWEPAVTDREEPCKAPVVQVLSVSPS